MRIGESMKTFAEVDRQVIPIIGKCLDEITKAAESVDHKNVSVALLVFFFSIDLIFMGTEILGSGSAQELCSHRTKPKNSLLSQAALSEAECAQIISQIYLTPRKAFPAILFSLGVYFFFFF